MNRSPNHSATENEVKSPPDRNVLAVDGPAGSGKTTVALQLASRLGAVLLDTGLLYRAVTLLALRSNLRTNDGAELANRIRNGAISLRPATVPDGRSCDVILEGEDVTDRLRTAEIDRNVSAFSAIPDVRAALLPVQRSFAEDRRVIVVGRDIATVVFPEAAVKIYLNASSDERARRRWAELVADGTAVTFDEVRADLGRRDGIDSSRETAPLQMDDGAILVNTDGKSIDQVVSEVATIAEEIWNLA